LRASDRGKSRLAIYDVWANSAFAMCGPARRALISE
jgi:hypothetical protein